MLNFSSRTCVQLHSFEALTGRVRYQVELEKKFHIHAHPCIILYTPVQLLWIQLFWMNRGSLGVAWYYHRFLHVMDFATAMRFSFFI